MKADGQYTIVTFESIEERWIFDVLGMRYPKHGDTVSFLTPPFFHEETNSVYNVARPNLQVPRKMFDFITRENGYVSVPFHAGLALSSLYCGARGLRSPERCSENMLTKVSCSGVGVVITDWRSERFLLSVKDQQHPNEKCRGRFSLISGGIESCEGPAQAVCRELYEEVSSTRIATLIASHLVAKPHVVLPSVQWDGEYGLFYYSAAIENDDVFDLLHELWECDLTLNEGVPAVLTREELVEEIHREREHSGIAFVASHHKILEKFIPIRMLDLFV